jgi:hypothetical protein
MTRHELLKWFGFKFVFNLVVIDDFNRLFFNLKIKNL